MNGTMQIKSKPLKRHMMLCNSDMRKSFEKIPGTTQIKYEKQSGETHGAMQIKYAKKEVVTERITRCYTH